MSIRDAERKFLVAQVFVSFAKVASRQFGSNTHGDPFELRHAVIFDGAARKTTKPIAPQLMENGRDVAATFLEKETARTPVAMYPNTHGSEQTLNYSLNAEGFYASISRNR